MSWESESLHRVRLMMMLLGPNFFERSHWVLGKRATGIPCG